MSPEKANSLEVSFSIVRSWAKALIRSVEAGSDSAWGRPLLPRPECAQREVTRSWPFATVKLEDPRLEGVEIRCRVTVPNAFDDVFIGSLPVAMAEISLINSASTPKVCWPTV